MTRQHRQTISRGGLHAVAPEYLLLLTICGSREMRRCVEAELDRRAAVCPKHLRAEPRSSPPLRPAA